MRWADPCVKTPTGSGGRYRCGAGSRRARPTTAAINTTAPRRASMKTRRSGGAVPCARRKTRTPLWI
nr:MAG TPA_asm: hypothetical protein [Caudoviricetes sp.]